MRVVVVYSGNLNEKNDEKINDFSHRHYGKFTGSGYSFQDEFRDLEFKIPSKYIAGFLTEITEAWKNLKLHNVRVYRV
jgi:hypothetical protein